MSTQEAWWPRRRIEAGEAPDLPETDKEARAMNAYNARVDAAVNSLLAHAARWAVILVGGCFLIAHALNVVSEALA